ncbi:hypothetical protein DPMN_167628, partial [Dreissena polymorpha]
MRRRMMRRLIWVYAVCLKEFQKLLISNQQGRRKQINIGAAEGLCMGGGIPSR